MRHNPFDAEFVRDASLVPNGFEQITSLSSSTALTVPADSILAIISCEAQIVRWRDDGTAPTAAIGNRLAADSDNFGYNGDLAAIRFIEEVSGGILDVSYYK